MLMLTSLACLAVLSGPSRGGTLYQFSVLETLMKGQYDGRAKVGDVLRHGNLGIGTYDGLEGEMVVLDGKAYQVLADGTAHVTSSSITTPFAAVTKFRSRQRFLFSGVSSKEALQTSIAARLDPKGAYALRIHGFFPTIRTRSFARQRPPFRPLPELMSQQVTFDFTDTRFILVGFLLPAHLQGVNQAGFHFHGLTEDRRRGGHILDFTIRDATVEVMPIDRLEIDAPAVP